MKRKSIEKSGIRKLICFYCAWLFFILFKMQNTGMLKVLTHIGQKLKILLRTWCKKIQQNKQILKNNKVSNFVNYWPKLKEYLDVSTDKLDIQMVPFKANEVVGREFSIATGLIIGYCQTLLCHIIACKMAFHFYQHKWYIT